MKTVRYSNIHQAPAENMFQAHWKTAEGPLAAALKNDLTRSVTLGFKMVRTCEFRTFHDSCNLADRRTFGG
jgi:hypothetical protein